MNLEVSLHEWLQVLVECSVDWLLVQRVLLRRLEDVFVNISIIGTQCGI